MYQKRNTLLIVLLLTVCSAGSFAQNPLSPVLSKLDTFQRHTLQEKLFIHTDRSFYLTGEILWFKIYYVDAILLRPLNVSKVAYVEIIDGEKKAILQTKIALQEDGNGYGSVFLPASINSGQYLLRAYTNWMKNFSPEMYFQQSLTIINPFIKLGLKPAKETIQYDMQFFPEGGYLVDGLKSKVGFRAVDQTGKSIAFKGYVINENGDTLTHFEPLKFGLGNFTFVPLADHRYKAVIKDSKGKYSFYDLPEIHKEGYVMQVSDSTADDIKITVSIKLANVSNPTLYLLVQNKQRVSTTKMSYLYNGKTEFLVNKNELKGGISHLTVFNGELQPVTERLYFKPEAGKVQLDIQPDQSQYATRRKVSLNVYTHQDNSPAAANMSVAVYKLDSTQQAQPSIVDYFLLTSELNGYIESPDYYLTTSEDGASKRAIDNLLLTHGWSGFPWSSIFAPIKKDEFIPETGGHIISGQVTDQVSGLPTDHIVTYLSYPQKNINLYLSRSKDGGKIQFETQNFYGNKELILQTDTEVDSTYQIKILNPFSEKFGSYSLPLFDLSESLKNAVLQRSIHMQVQNTFYQDKNSQFVVPVVDSIPFYGRADERYLLDSYTRFPTMEEVMREYVPGVLVRKNRGKFHFKTLDEVNKAVFNDNPLVLLDGVPVFDIDRIMAFDPRKIKKLDVMTRKYYLGVLSFDGIVSYTTYKGDLANFQPDTKSLIMNYDGVQPYREFFSPRYETSQSRETTLPDVRTLLHWGPAVQTDNLGKGLVSFYTSDIPGKYAVVIQGMTRQGVPVSSSKIIEVKEKSNY